MEISKLTLSDFRNYKQLELSLENKDEITYLYGNNAQGKTNLLEAIYVLALTKSFRAGKNHEMISWDADYCRITAELKTESEPKKLEVFYGKPPQPRKSLKINGVKTSSHNFIGNCNIVFFHPEDLNMLYLGPQLRRRYLDIMNLQVNGRYYLALIKFKRFLEQRNSLLKRIKDNSAQPADLDIWDQQLSAQGQIIIETRKQAVNFINQYLTPMYQKISEGVETVIADYKSSSGEDFDLSLRGNRERDIAAQVTTSGPHRDDLQFIINNKPIAEHASRGEYRSLLLALKLIEIKYYEQISGEKPILLLDDVFSELDEKRSQTLLEEISGQQTFLTTTESIPSTRNHRSLNNYTVKQGKIEAISGNK